MNFIAAITMLQKGFKIARKNWNGEYIEIVAGSLLLFRHLKPACEYTLSYMDLIAEDWEVVR